MIAGLEPPREAGAVADTADDDAMFTFGEPLNGAFCPKVAAPPVEIEDDGAGALGAD